MQQDKKRKGIPIENKKKKKLFLFADELTIYVESTKEQHYNS